MGAESPPRCAAWRTRARTRKERQPPTAAGSPASGGAASGSASAPASPVLFGAAGTGAGRAVMVIATSSKCEPPSPARTVIVPAWSPIRTFPDESTLHPSAVPVIEYFTAAEDGSAVTESWTSFRFHVPVLGFGADASTVVLSAFAPRYTAGPA